MKSYEKYRQHIKKQRHYFANKDLSSQSYGFACSHVWMWDLDHKEKWVLKNWCFWTVVLAKTLESPLDCKIKSGNPKGNQYWVFIGSVHWFWSWSSKPLATLCDKLPHWKRPWCWERLKAGGEVDNRRWDGWMASLTRWMWVWASFGRWWWDKAAWHAEVHEVAKTQTWLRDWTKLSSMLEKRKIYTSAKITFWTRYLFDSFIKEM